MGKHSSKRRHVSSSDSSSASPPVSKKRRGEGPDDAKLKRLIQEALLEFGHSRSSGHDSRRDDLSDVSSVSDFEDDAGPTEEQKGKYISKDSLKDILSHVKSNMGFQDVAVQIEERRVGKECRL